MIWDYATGQEFVRIETVKGNDAELLAEIPITDLEASETAAMVLCVAHNRMHKALEQAVEFIAELQRTGCPAGVVAVPSRIADGLLS